MISKIFSNSIYFLLQQRTSTLTTNFLFSTASGRQGREGRQGRQYHPLRNKIMDLSSFDSFKEFFNNKKDQFDASCYTTASRTLAKIIIDQRLNFYPEHRQVLKRFLDNVAAINFDTINHNELSHVLYLLRILKNDPNNQNLFVYNYIRSIISRAQNKFKQLQAETSFNRLCYYYQQLNSLKMKNTNFIAKRLCALLQNGQNSDTDTPLFLSVTDMTLLLKGMRTKDHLSYEDMQLFKIVINNVMDKHITNISFFELAQVSIGLNEVLQKNQSLKIGEFIQKVEQIHKKVLANIEQMDQKSIMYILGSIKTRNQTYNKIYRTIFQKIFQEITPNGQSSFNQLFTLRLFGGISNKLRLHMTSQQNQEKFFVFLKNTIIKNPRYINSFVQKYVQNDFFNNKHLLRIVGILQLLTQFNPKLSLLYSLSIRNINVQKIMDFDRPTVQLKDKHLLLLTLIVENQLRRSKQQSQKQKYSEILNKCKQRFLGVYKAEDNTFSKFIQNLQPKYYQCLKVMNKQINHNYPNPYETQQSAFYKKAWLKALVYSQNQNQFSRVLMPKFSTKITNFQDVQAILKSILNSNIQHKLAMTNTIVLISKTYKLALAKPQSINFIFNFLQSRTELILQHHNWDQTRSRFWYLLSQLLENVPNQLFFKSSTAIIRKIIRLQSPQTFYSQNYLSFLQKLVKLSSKMATGLASQLIQEAIRVNCINRELAKQIPQQLVQNLKRYEKIMLRSIQKSQYAMEGVQLAKETLHVFLHNNCPQVHKIIKQNQQKILNFINQMKFSQLWNCITHFKLGQRKQSAIILQKLFECFNKNNIQFEKYNPSFVASVLRKNNLHQSSQKIQNLRGYFKKALQYYSIQRNLDKLTFQGHNTLIKDCNDFRVKNDDYYHLLLARLPHEQLLAGKQLFLTLGNVGFQLKPQQLSRLVKRDLYAYTPAVIGKNFNIFILFQEQFQNPKQVLSKLIQKYNHWKATEKMSLYQLNYQYLKKKYPQETKDFEPNATQKMQWSRSIEQDAQPTMTKFRTVLEDVCKDSFVQGNLFGNYYYNFRNVTLLFPSYTKNHGENNAFKKIFTELLQSTSKIVIISRKSTYLKSIVKYLVSNTPGLVTAAEQEQIFKKCGELNVKKESRQAKTQSTQAQIEQIIEQQIEVEIEKDTK